MPSLVTEGNFVVTDPETGVLGVFVVDVEILPSSVMLASVGAKTGFPCHHISPKIRNTTIPPIAHRLFEFVSINHFLFRCFTVKLVSHLYAKVYRFLDTLSTNICGKLQSHIRVKFYKFQGPVWLNIFDGILPQNKKRLRVKFQ